MPGKENVIQWKTKDLKQIFENEEGYEELFKFLRDISVYDNI